MLTVKQIPPEQQECPITDEMWEKGQPLEKVSVTGNRDYQERVSSLFSMARRIFRELEDVTAEEAVGMILELHPEVSPDLAKKSADAFIGCLHQHDREGAFRCFVCTAMEMFSGEQYSFRRINGSVQGEWNYMFYPEAEWTERRLRDFETMYWNLGEEYVVTEDSEGSLDGVSVYTCEQGHRLVHDLVKQLRVNPWEIRVFRFTGWTRAAAYEAVPA